MMRERIVGIERYENGLLVPEAGFTSIHQADTDYRSIHNNYLKLGNQEKNLNLLIQMKLKK